MQLRPYQQLAIDEVRADFRRGIKRVLLVMPTGAGKTVAFAHVVQGAQLRGKQTLILAHRIELIEQISDALTEFDVAHGFIAAGRPYRRNMGVYVGSTQTVIRRLESLPPAQFIVVDEAHHATTGNTLGQILAHYPAAHLLGVTATPTRASGEGLGQVFGSMVEGPTTAQLIADGYLAPFKIYGPPTINTEGLHIRAGEFIPAEVAERVDAPRVMGDVIDHYRKLADGKQAIVFCYSVADSQATAAAFRDAGYKFEHLDGGCDRGLRASIVSDYRAKRIQGLTSCDLFSEGFDCPGIEVGIFKRPTASLALSIQQFGRCLRISEGKDMALLIDHAGNASRHGFPDDAREWSLDGKEKRPKAGDKPPGVRVCAECFYANRAGSITCKGCNAPFPVSSREVDEVDGELVELQRKQARRSQGEAQTLEELQTIGKQRGYHPMWAKHVLSGRKRA